VYLVSKSRPWLLTAWPVHFFARSETPSDQFRLNWCGPTFGRPHLRQACTATFLFSSRAARSLLRRRPPPCLHAAAAGSRSCVRLSL